MQLSDFTGNIVRISEKNGRISDELMPMKSDPDNDYVSANLKWNQVPTVFCTMKDKMSPKQLFTQHDPDRWQRLTETSA